MSSGKAWPPRVWFPSFPNGHSKECIVYAHQKPWDAFDQEYLSLEESSALMQAKDKEIERLRAALEWYAKEINWQDYYYDAGDEPGDIQMAICESDVDYRRDKDTGDVTWSCGGKRAREALAGGEDESPL